MKRNIISLLTILTAVSLSQSQAADDFEAARSLTNLGSDVNTANAGSLGNAIGLNGSKTEDLTDLSVVTKGLNDQTASSGTLAGTWVNYSNQMMMMFNNEGFASIGVNGNVSVFFYSVQGNTIQLRSQSGEQFSMNFVLSGDTLNVTIDNQNYSFTRYSQGAQTVPPAQNTVPAPQITVPQTPSSGGLNGNYYCTVQNMPQLSLIYVYSGNSYQAAIYNNNQIVTTSTGTYSVSGNLYQYQVTNSTDPSAIGVTGTSNIQISGNGYSLTNEGLVVNCQKM